MDERHLIGYLPIDRRVGLASGRPLPAAATGAALFADIAGFTLLSRELTREYGARGGAQRISDQLNVVYRDLTGEVHGWGGSVVDFSGDAVMCWFDDAPNGIPASSGGSRAVSCAVRLQELIARLPPIVMGDGDPVHLSIKVAVTTGSVRRAAVGDPAHRLVDVIAGPPVSRVASVERHARHGEVVVDEATARCLPGLRISEWRSGDDRVGRVAVVDGGAGLEAERCPWPEVSLDVAVVSEWVAAPLRDRPEASLTELRPTASMFIRFDGIDGIDGFDGFDQSAGLGGLEVVDRFVREVQHVVAGHDGAVIQVTMGDKGGYLYVAFGAPTAHEDVAERAAAAALELGAEHPLRCGLALGLSRTGAYGGPECRTYGVLGESVNLAAGLMSIAGSGEILATPGFTACGVGFVFDELPAVRLKGNSGPVAVVRLVGRGVPMDRIRYRTRLVGRRDELQELLAMVGLITTGSGGTLVVEGDAGIGKSHLIERVREMLLNSEDVSWFECRASEHASGPLAAFLPLLADLFFQALGVTDDDRRQLFDVGIDGLVGDLESSGTAAAFDAGRRVQASRPYIGALLGLHWNHSAYEQHDPRTRFDRCLAGVDDLLRAESMRRPAVVHLRDAHWLDPESASVVARLSASAREVPLTVVIDQRPTGAIGPHRTIELSGLGSDGVQDLVEGLLDGPADANLVALLLDRSEGSPLFVEQLVLDLRERGRLASDGSSPWRLVAGPEGDFDTDVPLTLAAVLLSRIDRLGMQPRAVVQLAAVLGTEFRGDVLAEMTLHDMTTSELAEAFSEAERAGVWRPVADRPGWKAFAHALLRQTAYDTQLDERLRRLHRRAGAAIEAVVPAAEPGRSAELGHHAERAGDGTSAWAHLVAAGRGTAAHARARRCARLPRASAGSCSGRRPAAVRAVRGATRGR